MPPIKEFRAVQSDFATINSQARDGYAEPPRIFRLRLYMCWNPGAGE
jgi:hypothetical protein